jgi:hypothetical protein
MICLICVGSLCLLSLILFEGNSLLLLFIQCGVVDIAKVMGPFVATISDGSVSSFDD